MNLADDQDDPLPDADDVRAIAQLTQDDLRTIDEAILTNSNAQWRKVAFIFAVAMDEHPGRYYDIPDVYYSQRIRELVSLGQLESQGNLRRMRYSEIRLARPGNEA